MRRTLLLVATVAILAATTDHQVLAGQGGDVRNGTGPCDRSCLEGFVDRFLDGFVKHDPKLLPLAGNARYTENGQRLELGDGSWRTMVARGTYRLLVSDPAAGEVAFIGSAPRTCISRGCN
jgi:hypothetical protein